MANYRLLSTGSTIVDVPSESSLDTPHVAQLRRGTVHKTLGGLNVIQYSDVLSTGDHRIVWTIPLATASEYGRLYSASIGLYGDRLVLFSPQWGDIAVAVAPGEEGFKVEKHRPESFGYSIVMTFVRLS